MDISIVRRDGERLEGEFAIAREAKEAYDTSATYPEIKKQNRPICWDTYRILAGSSEKTRLNSLSPKPGRSMGLYGRITA